MVDHFESAKDLIERASHHTRDLEAQWQAFVDSKPYSIVIQENPETGDKHHIIRVDAAPKLLKILAFDAANSFRASLDHAVYASTVTLGNLSPKSTKFPFGDTAEDFEGDIKRRCRDVHPAIIDVIRRTKPYKAGNLPLWGLNKLRNKKTHQILVAMASRSSGITGERKPININIIKGPVAIIPTPAGLNLAQNEFAVFRQERGAILEYDIEPILEIRIPEIGGVQGPDAIRFFNYLIEMTQYFVSGIEAETVRILRERTT